MNKTNKSLASLFESIVMINSDKNAIVYPDGREITYSMIDKLSEKISTYFESNDLNKGDRVLIAGDKSLLMFSTIIAALKRGIVYSIYDIEIPSDRLKNIIITCEPRMLLGSMNQHTVAGNECRVNSILFHELESEIESLNKRITDCSTRNDNPIGSDIAYIVFTSGSTGLPKGATMTHSNVIELIDWSSKEFAFGPGEILTNLNPAYFDNFVFDFYSSIFTGATLVPFTNNELRNPQYLLKAISNLGCTSWFSVPSLLIYLDAMKAFSAVDFTKLKRIIFGGEGYPKSKLLNLYNNFKENISFYNVYGPSECTCICSCYEVTDIDFQDLDGFLPIGQLVHNFDYCIIDDDFNIVPSNTKGELCLIGPAVGCGYFNKPDLTTSSFIREDRIHGKNDNRIAYRTGDIVSFNAQDSKLYIYGRMDNQIKHMGYRIELEDIENAIMKIPSVTQACCIHKIRDGVSRISAFLAVSAEMETLLIKNELSKLIPVYMIPTNFIYLKELPKNKNGKVDRVALADKM